MQTTSAAASAAQLFAVARAGDRLSSRVLAISQQFRDTATLEIIS